ncbi:NAD(P)/FAD-dependent oxidoreductase [Pullulanibacillus pueri]|nr:NAD(P)/FAD-dependent oxidoreductase [Pullulanibacillus pueri]
MIFDSIIIGGGISGLQAAIQLGRYGHRVLVFDSNQGRSNLCQCYHNLLGWPEGVSGQSLRDIGKAQAERLGIQFYSAKVIKAVKKETYIEIEDEGGAKYRSQTLLLATGVKDRMPLFQELKPCLGISVYICPDCDGYEIKNQRTIVLGSGNPGAQMALTLTYFTDELMYVNHERAPIDEDVIQQLVEKSIPYYNEGVREVFAKGAAFKGVLLENGQRLDANHAFSAFGGNEVRSDLAEQLGVELHHNKHINTHPRTKMTNVENVWAAGDVTVHSEQVAIAMGDGLQAAIWMHKQLLKMMKGGNG